MFGLGWIALQMLAGSYVTNKKEVLGPSQESLQCSIDYVSGHVVSAICIALLVSCFGVCWYSKSLKLPLFL